MFKKIALMTSLLLAGCGGGDSSSEAGKGGTGSAPTQYDVTASATANGSITPAKTSVTQGQTATFTLTPDEGYRIASATGCNGILNNNVYTTGSVTENCNVTANFSALQFTLSTNAGPGGSISPASIAATYNEQISFQLTPEQGYQVDQISGCGGTLDELRRTYTTAPVTAECAVDASFARSEFIVTSQSSGGGTISPASLQLSAGARAEFTISTAAGFRFKQVEGCSGIFEGGKFVIPAVSENCVITASFNDERYIEFPDPELARAVRKELSIAASEPISATLVAEKIIYFSIYNKGVARLDGLQYAANLTALFAGGNNITDISVLTRLPAENAVPKLRVLDLWNNKLSTLPDMGIFTNLKTLSLSRNKLTSITALTELTHLEELTLNDNDIDDLSVLSGLSSLNYLSLNGLNVTDDDVRMLNSSTLSTLHLESTKVSSLEPFTHFTQLKSLSLFGTYVQNLTPLKHFAKLEYFSIAYTPVTDLAPLLELSLTDTAQIRVGGCLKMEGFSRAKTVMDQLISQGKSVRYQDWGGLVHTTCPDTPLIDSITAQAEINDTGLQLNWQVQSSDAGPWQCELHYDLDSQLPRIPAQVLENCHSQQSWVIPEFNRDTVVAHLVLDDGVTKTKSRVDLGRLRHVNGIADPVLGSYDWLQVVVKSHPYLVPWRDARLRLHVLSDTGVAPPQVLVAAKHNGISTALQVTPPSTLPQEKQHSVLSRSYLVNVPAAQLKPGTEFVVTIANQPQQVIAPKFAAVNSIDLTLVPFKLGEQVTTLPSLQLVEDSLLKVWPLANINIISRPPYELSTPAAQNTTSSMLRELNDLRVVEGSSNYYYGYFVSEINTDAWGGLAYRPGTSAVGQLPYNGLDTVLQHELGHNFGRPHAPCGSAGTPDANYPYAGGSIGSYGVALDLTSLIDPATSKDVMSYCSNKHVSDYNFELVQDYLTAITSAAVHLRESAAAQTNSASNSSTADIATAASKPALYYRVNISSLSQPLIEQTIQLNQLPVLTSSSEFQLMAEYTGEPPAAYAVEKLINGHGEPMPQLSFAVPLYKNGKPLSAWGLYQNKRVLLEHKVVSPGLANPTMAALANSAKITEKGNEVCVDMGSVAVDGANLLLLADQQRYAIAMNAKQRAFCRDTTGYPTTGRWQLQLRKNADVQLIELAR